MPPSERTAQPDTERQPHPSHVRLAVGVALALVRGDLCRRAEVALVDVDGRGAAGEGLAGGLEGWVFIFGANR